MSVVREDVWLQESNDPSIISGAGKNGNELTIWHRQPAADLAAAAAEIPHEVLPDSRWQGPLSGFARQMDMHLMSLPPAYRDAMAVLADDANDLAHWFDDHGRAPEYTFRCHPLTETMCPRFHTDSGHMRMLCTYRGPGTVWVPNEAVNLRALNAYGTNNDEILADASAMRSIPLFAGAVLCGCDNKGHGGVVHRSPVVPSGVSRFTVCITPEYD